MSNVGANAFLSSKFNSQTIGPNPTTERGNPTIINAHPKEPRIIYPCGKFIVVRHLHNPNDCFIYRGHGHKTTVAKFSPNGFWVCSADVSGKVLIWSWDNPEHFTKLETMVFAGSVLDVDWDNESKKVVAVGDGSSISAKVFTWDTGNSAGEMVGHSKRITSVAYKPSRPFRIMTGSEDMRTVLYSGPPFKFTLSNSTHSNFVNSVRYSPDGSKAVSVGSDKKIQFYAGESGEPTSEVVNAHDGTIFAASFSPDGNKLLTCSADKTLKVWDVASVTAEHVLSVSADPQIGDMQVSCLWVADCLVSLSLNGNINVFSAANPTAPPRVIQAHQESITSMCVDRANSIVYTGSNDGVVISRNLTTGQTQKLITTDKKAINGGAHHGKVVGVGLSNGELVSVGFDDTARFASLSTSAYYNDLSLGSQPTSLSSSGSLTAITTKDILIFRGHERVASLGNLGYGPVSSAILNESEIAVGGDDNKVHVYSISGSSLTPVTTLETRAAITALTYSPDGSHLAVGDAGRQIEVFERGSWTAKVGGKWCFHTSKVTCLAWSPSGGLLASGSTDENIFIWNFSKHSAKVNFQFSHSGGVTGLDWMNDTSLVSVGNDQVVATWNVPDVV